MSNNVTYKIIEGDAFFVLPALRPECIDCVFTSPEPPMNYKEMEALQATFLQIPRLLKPTGSIWVQMPDYHNTDGNMACIPERFVLSMVEQHDWKLKAKRIWYRPTEEPIDPNERRFRRDWEYLYWFVKDSNTYYWNIYEDDFLPEANTSVVTAPYKKPDPGAFESGLPEDVIFQSLALTCPEGGTVLDPFAGTGTTGKLAIELGMNFLGIELNPELIPKINKRLTEWSQKLGITQPTPPTNPTNPSVK